MTFAFNFQEWLQIYVSVRKPTFNKHPAVSSEVVYRGSSLYTEKEKVFEGLLYDNYKKEYAINTALCTLGTVFSRYGFVYDDYPDHIEHGFQDEILWPYKHSRFPIGSTFRVVKLLIDSNVDFYYVLDNSVEGLVLGDARILRLFPEIMKKYASPVTWDDSAHGYLSKELIGKQFKVLEFGICYDPHKVEEL